MFPKGVGNRPLEVVRRIEEYTNLDLTRYPQGVTVKVKDIYKSKELWRGPESIYTLKHGQCVAHDKRYPGHIERI
jgi:hypothetical protein